MVMEVFEGNKKCRICEKTIVTEKHHFKVSLKGFTYMFCDNCFKNKKDEVRDILTTK